MNDGSPHELSAAYALDALDGDDLRAYEAHLAGCERCREDVASFRGTAAALAYDIQPLEPPAELERRILTAARAKRPNVVPLRQRWAIPSAAFGAVGIWAIHLSNSLDKQRSQNKSQNAIVAILSDCTMTPAKGASARVCVAPTRKAVLTVDNLEPAGPGKTYEAWVIAGKRVQPAGLFHGGAGRTYLRLTKSVPAVATVAVTREKAGGVAAPTGGILISAKVKPT